MKKKIALCLCALVLTISFIFGQDVDSKKKLDDNVVSEDAVLNESGENSIEVDSSDRKSAWKFSIVTDFAYYPKSDYKASMQSHFAPLSGVFSGLEVRTTGHATFKCPLGNSSHPLFKSNFISADFNFELTPVSMAPGIKIKYSPIAFLEFSAGSSIGFAWDFAPMKIQGIALYDSATDTYLSKAPFSAQHFDVWAQGLFMFDLAALLPGDWTHVITADSIKITYDGVNANQNVGQPWKYQGIGSKFNGFKLYSSLVLGYQLPSLPVLNTIAVQTELETYCNSSIASSAFQKWDPDFLKVSINPLIVFDFGKKDQLWLVFGFSSRRSFTTPKADLDATDFTLTAAPNAREWYFNRIALSYTHTF